IEFIQKIGDAVESVTVAGSLRRRKETIGDLDLLVTMHPSQDKQKNIDAVAEHVLTYPRNVQTLAHGENKVSMMLESGLQVDVRLLTKNSFGAALLYFTGSKDHNVALRGRANDAGWTLNEYALTSIKSGRTIAAKSEEEIYAKLKLPYIEPELREMRGEIEAAEEGKLPALVKLEDMRGDVQMHSTASDGRNTIEEMGQAAKALGYEYIAITDHSKAVSGANDNDARLHLDNMGQI